jgi:hypothetical protein
MPHSTLLHKQALSGQPGGWTAETYPLGGQGSAGTRSRQPPGPHYIVLLHMGQRGTKGDCCGREGVNRHSRDHPALGSCQAQCGPAPPLGEITQKLEDLAPGPR